MAFSGCIHCATKAQIGAIHLWIHPTDTLFRMAALESSAKFERHVDGSGYHHVWTGGTNPLRGTGRLKVDGKQVTAHRRAWELAFGAVPVGSAVRPRGSAVRAIRTPAAKGTH